MKEYKIKVRHYSFNCPQCGTGYDLNHTASGNLDIECGDCKCMMHVDASELPELYCDAEEVFRLGKQSFDWGNYDDALFYLNAAVECNHPGALFLMRRLYSDGLGVEQNKDTALKYLEKAAAMGSCDALNDLGNIAAGKDEIEKAKKYYLTAAYKGNSDAMYNYGYTLAGENAETVNEEAIKWLERAGNKGDPFSYNKIGLIYESVKDYPRAFEWYRRAANAGGASGMFNYGRFLKYSNILSTELPPPDEEKAFGFVQKAARLNNTAAMQLLATFYEEGKVIEKDENKMLIWRTRAAEAGVDLAQLELGLWYYKQKHDIQKALEWTKKSYDQGYEYAIKIYPQLLEEYNQRAAAGHLTW